MRLPFVLLSPRFPSVSRCCRRIAHCSASDDIVSECRKLPSDAEELTDSMMRSRIYKLKMPQLRRFWDFSPRFVLCVCPRQDASRAFVKKDPSLRDSSAGGDAVAPDEAHTFVARGAQRWRHIHSAALASIVPSALPPLAPARAAKLFSWMRSGKPAWQSHDSSIAWQSTFRESDAAIASPGSGGADAPDLNRWVSKSLLRVDTERPLPVMYEISVVTGSEFGAGTDARVFCTLYGEDGAQSPELPLAVSLQHKDPFETGQLGTFYCSRPLRVISAETR